MRVCSEPGCPRLTTTTRCKQHTSERRQASDAKRPPASKRGYDNRWRRTRQAFLAAHPNCIDCGNQADVADHDPTSRRDLVNQGDPDPDSWHHLQPRCTPCHNKRTAQAQPGGFNA